MRFLRFAPSSTLATSICQSAGTQTFAPFVTASSTRSVSTVASDAKIQRVLQDRLDQSGGIGGVMLAVAVDLDCDVVAFFSRDLITCLDGSADSEVAGKAGDEGTGF